MYSQYLTLYSHNYKMEKESYNLIVLLADWRIKKLTAIIPIIVLKC